MSLAFDLSEFRKRAFRVFQRPCHSRVAISWNNAWTNFPFGESIDTANAQLKLRTLLENMLQTLKEEAEKFAFLELFGVLQILNSDVFFAPPSNRSFGDRTNISRILFLAAAQWSRTDTGELSTFPSLADLITNGEMGMDRIKILFDAACFLQIAEKTYRLLGRADEVTFSDPSAFTLRNIDAVLESLRIYDLRVNQQLADGGMLSMGGVGAQIQLGKAEKYDLPFVSTVHKDLAQSLKGTDRKYPFPVIQPEFSRNGFGVEVCELGSIYRFLNAMPIATNEKTGLAPNEIRACVLGLKHLLEQHFAAVGFSGALGMFGALVVTNSEFDAAMNLALHHEVGIETDQALRIAQKFQVLFDPPPLVGMSLFDTAWAHRYMTLPKPFVSLAPIQKIVVNFDSFVTHDLPAWLVTRQFEAIAATDEKRGDHFERWFPVGFQETASRMGTRLGVQALPGKKLFRRVGQNEELITNVDVLIAFNEWLILIDCYSRVVSDEVLRGEAASVGYHWAAHSEKLSAWDSKMREVFCDNPNQLVNSPKNNWILKFLRGRKFVIPCLSTPRPEWSPEIRLADFMHTGVFLPAERTNCPIPRVCTPADIVRVLASGGPTPSAESAWVLTIPKVLRTS